MNIIDFRYRPPYKSYRETIMYRDLERSRICSESFGMSQSTAVAARDFNASLQEMTTAGIGMAVLAGRKVLPHIGVVDNEDIFELVRDYPERFVGLAGVDPTDIEAAKEEINTYVISKGLKGIVMEPGLVKKPLFIDDEHIYPIYEQCQTLGLPVMLMVGSNCGPTIEYSKPCHAEAVAATFPKLKLILSHGGWPWVTEMIHIAYRYKNVYLLPDLYLFNAPGYMDYLTAASYILKSQMLFGSAYPYVSLQESVDYFKNGRVRDEALPYFMEYNAKRVLGL